MQYPLRELLAQDILLPVINKSGLYSVTIKETAVDAKLKQVEICGLAQDDEILCAHVSLWLTIGSIEWRKWDAEHL